MASMYSLEITRGGVTIGGSVPGHPVGLATIVELGYAKSRSQRRHGVGVRRETPGHLHPRGFFQFAPARLGQKRQDQPKRE